VYTFCGIKYCRIVLISYVNARYTLSSTAHFQRLFNSPTSLFVRCETCHLVRPPRASHCKQIGRCVLRYDHYCPWNANAIALGNHKYFLLLLLYGTAAVGMVQGALFSVFSQYYFNGGKVPHLTLWILLLENGFCFVMCLLMLLLQFLFQARNITTKEFYAWLKQGDPMNFMETFPVKYDLGTYANFIQVFGPDVIMWWCPWMTGAINEGYRWPTRLPKET